MQLAAGAEGLDRLRCTVADELAEIRYAVREGGMMVTRTLQEMRVNTANMELMIRDVQEDSMRNFEDLSSKLQSVERGLQNLQVSSCSFGPSYKTSQSNNVACKHHAFYAFHSLTQAVCSTHYTLNMLSFSSPPQDSPLKKARMQLHLFKAREGKDLTCLDEALKYSLEAMTLVHSLDALFSACVVGVSADYIVHARVRNSVRKGHFSVTQRRLRIRCPYE